MPETVIEISADKAEAIKQLGRALRRSAGRAGAAKARAPKSQHSFGDGVPDDDESLVEGTEDQYRDFLNAPELRRVAMRLIANDKMPFGFLKEVEVRFLWKRKGGKSGGAETLGRCVALTGLQAHLADGPRFAVWLGADNCRAARLNSRQIEALVFHELCHAYVDPETGAAKTVAHDFEGFLSELRTYGPWKEDLQRMQDAARQGVLPGFEGV